MKRSLQVRRCQKLCFCWSGADSINKFKALLLVMLKLSMLIGYAEIKHSYWLCWNKALLFVKTIHEICNIQSYFFISSKPRFATLKFVYGIANWFLVQYLSLDVMIYLIIFKGIEYAMYFLFVFVSCGWVDFEPRVFGCETNALPRSHKFCQNMMLRRYLGVNYL